MIVTDGRRLIDAAQRQRIQQKIKKPEGGSVPLRLQLSKVKLRVIYLLVAILKIHWKMRMSADPRE
jgi:hypothetical protein